MKKVNLKKTGISMVALVITIIVLIVLTSAVVITGIGAPKQAQLATFYSNIDIVQDLVSLEMGNNMIEGALGGYGDNYKWTGIVAGYGWDKNNNVLLEPENAFDKTSDGIEENIEPIMISLLDKTTMEEGEKEKYYVGESGKVYYQGFEYEGKTYYNKDKNVEGTNKPIEVVVVLPHTPISTTDSFVGYYADFEGDGEIEGIIYADLLIGGSGEWIDHDGTYTINQIPSSKAYYVSQASYRDEHFGIHPVITPMGAGEERFYIMELSDISNYSYYWYKNAVISEHDTKEGFGEGRKNTITMLAAWNTESYGAQKTELEENDWGAIVKGDLWGAIGSKVADGWFVPSKEEWSAFGHAFQIEGQDDFSMYGLSDWYWSSSIVIGDFNNAAWSFYVNFMYYDAIWCSGDPDYIYYCVRLSNTF